ncbi:hypothetical protein PENNAL_c0016G06596 [Penicillium nalgiovense]|uniref:Uncharacterized protein n=1 Tax=Penicillium nalgiovense TaxID=60175 RepID=A0A1V6YMP8_PENNA|nr:hypothetical protein PENNAL_c0016G06596 [Penicillium nalgiovense]
MSSPESLIRPEWTTATLNQSPESPLNIVDVGPSRWAIVSKVQERTNIMSQRDVTNGLGPVYVTEKFLCYPIGSSNTLAFMRVYKQVPIAGTEFKKASIRATQAVMTYEPTELTTLKSLQEKGCNVISRLLEYQCDQQDEDDTVPGGFITYVIWEKVLGESLDMKNFWGYSFSEREEIRLKFRVVYNLVRPPTAMDQIFPITSVDLKYDDKGWTW